VASAADGGPHPLRLQLAEGRQFLLTQALDMQPVGREVALFQQSLRVRRQIFPIFAIEKEFASNLFDLIADPSCMYPRPHLAA